MTGQDGPSKNELKKLAKKAEKASKKQQAKEAPTPTFSGATPALATCVPPKPTLLLANPTSSSSDPTLLKVLWAAQSYNVELKLAGAADASKVAGPFLSSGKPALLYGSLPVGGGGNAMAAAIAKMGEQRHSLVEQMIIDNWCEWERSTLRHAKNVKPALEHLATALSHGPGIHLVGHCDSVADICILSTLSFLPKEHMPPQVVHYLEAHQEAIESAKQTKLESSAPAVDMAEVSILKVLHDLFGATVTNTFGDITLPGHFVDKCKDPKHGDYQCNAAMPTFAQLKKSGSLPDGIQKAADVANVLVQTIGEDHPVIMELGVNGPGFVVCRLRPSFLQHHVNEFIKTSKLPYPKVTPQTCLVDFSSPNIAKEMHVGHLRSTIIGESVCRILEAVGHKVHRVNHVGDWGTQFGMLIQYLKEEYPDVGQSDDLPNITDLTVFYKSAKERFDASEEFKEQSRLNVVKLQSGDAECVKIWQMLCDVSRKEFEKVYKRLDVNVNECGESFYNEKIPAVIEEFEKAGKLSCEDQGGAKVVFVDKFQVPLMLQKSDGGYGYDSTDMAALKYRLFEIKADRIIIITDFTQSDHFKMVYAAGHDIGWVTSQRLQHIGFGTVQGEDGKRFKTRSGDTVRLVDLLDEAVSRMESSLKSRIAEGKANITLDEVHGVAEAIGYGAVKYYDLRRNPTSNYKFSYDEMLDTKGDTAVYLLYARVRLESIMAKAKAEHNVDVEDLLKAGEQIEISHESERNLVLSMLVFADVLEQTLDDLYPYHVCDYVYKLANAASDFVTKCKVLGSPEMKSRLLLCYATTVAIHECFDLLGIRHVKRI